MDKLLKVDFFKRLKFPTKESGMAFFNSSPEISQWINSKNSQLILHNCSVIDEFTSFLIPFQPLINTAVLHAKVDADQRKLDKQKLANEALRESLKNELRLEILRESQESLPKPAPLVLPNIPLQQISELFLQALHNPSHHPTLKTLSIDIHNALHTLQSSLKTLLELSQTTAPAPVPPYSA